MTRFLFPALIALIPVLPTAPALAQSAPDPADLVYAELLPGWRQADGTHIAGLQIALAPGWQTYWRAPGDGGIPPFFDWSGSRNLKGQSTAWPTPKVITKNGIRTIGYKDDVVWPMAFSAIDPSRDIEISARIDIGVCEDVCIPVTLNITGTLPAGAHDRDPRISDALNHRPEPAEKAGVTGVACAVDPTVDGLNITATIKMPGARAEDVVVFEHPDRSLWISEAEVSRTGSGLRAMSEFVSVEGGPFALDRSDIRITILGTDHAVDIKGCPAG